MLYKIYYIITDLLILSETCKYIFNGLCPFILLKQKQKSYCTNKCNYNYNLCLGVM